MTERQKKDIMNAACKICHYPHFLMQEQVDAVCVVCPVRHAIDIIGEEEALCLKTTLPN